MAVGVGTWATKRQKWYLTKFSESFLLDENELQNPQILRKTLRLFPEQSTLFAGDFFD
jgi:hypothetical protein